MNVRDRQILEHIRDYAEEKNAEQIQANDTASDV
jgi:hypothetical protein